MNRALTCGSTVQSYKVIGNINDVDNTTYYYIIFNDTQYQLEIAIKAIDACFKLYYILNLEYLSKAEQMQYFFKISDF